MKRLLRPVALGCVAATVLTAIQQMPAAAAPAGPVPTTEETLGLGREVDSPGVYRDTATGRMVVTVTSPAAAAGLRSRGATARVVPRDRARLDAAAESLARGNRVAGTSWGVDPVSNTVVLTVDRSVTGAALEEVRATAARIGDAVRVEQVPGVFSTHIAGGDAIYGGDGRCSLGFNVHDRAGKSFFLTAGHCGNGMQKIYSDPQHRTHVGTRSTSYFPGDDFAIFHYAPGVTSKYGVITNGWDITGAGNAFVGQPVQRTESTTGTRAGLVTRLDVTVNYASGATVYGMVQTTACSGPGDSGGPFYAGTIALGLHSGGVGGCSSATPVSFFQPVTEALNRYGVHVY